jgi:hypothetical protein
MITLDAAMYRAYRHVARAIRRGDFAAADRWTSLLERQAFLATRVSNLARREHRPKPLRPLPPPPPAPVQPERKMPVMLDPDGFSPGGTPNWVLNFQRLERAGLDRSLAPQKERPRKA